MTVFHTADPHFGHTNIIGYCNRPFPDVDAMDAALVERWNSVVRPEDTVWVHGDVALSARGLSRVRELHGEKILIAGNHDSCHEMHKRWLRAVDTYTAAGFAWVVPSGVVRGHDLGDGVMVDLAHFPFIGDSTSQDRYVAWRPVDEGRVLLCGHVHDRWRVSGRQVNVGGDVHDFYPVTEAALRELVAGLP